MKRRTDKSQQKSTRLRTLAPEQLTKRLEDITKNIALKIEGNYTHTQYALSGLLIPNHDRHLLSAMGYVYSTRGGDYLVEFLDFERRDSEQLAREWRLSLDQLKNLSSDAHLVLMKTETKRRIAILEVFKTAPNFEEMLAASKDELAQIEKALDHK